MSEIKPRFEFRCFAPDFGAIERRLRRLAPCEQIRESREIYIMSAVNNENNTKIRDAKMDIKVFVQELDGLEQWNPRMKGEFPMDAARIQADVFPAFGVAAPELNRERYTLDQFLDELIRPHADLVPVHVFKRRFAFTVCDCITEHAELRFNGAAIQTMAVESIDRAAIHEARRQLGLGEYENVNYLRAIKRVIGQLPLPEEWW